MRLVPSIGPWLPGLRDLLPQTVLLGGKAAELYYFSILERPTPALLVRETKFGVEKGGKAMQPAHESLIRQGFQRRTMTTLGAKTALPLYHREDLGPLEFICPDRGILKNPYTTGLAASPDPLVHLLLEDPHEVGIKYLNEDYSVRIPQTGRFILVNGLQLKLGPKAPPESHFRASQSMVLILYLLVLHEDLREEALNDLLHVRPASLIRDFQQNMKDNGPGTAVWEAAQKTFLELFPESKAVQLTTWYWKFLPALTKVLKDQKEDKEK
jgi:hypothetical protein